MGTQLDQRPGVLKVGFPTVEAHACESLKRDDKRKFLEGLLAGIAGAPTRLEMVVDASLPAPVHPEPALLLNESPAAKAAAKEASPAPAEAEPPKPAANEDFYKDPLITATIEAFKARIVSTKAPA